MRFCCLLNSMASSRPVSASSRWLRVLHIFNDLAGFVFRIFFIGRFFLPPRRVVQAGDGLGWLEEGLWAAMKSLVICRNWFQMPGVYLAICRGVW